MSEKTELHFGGIPTRPDVNKLRQQWPALKSGDTISYAEVSAIIGEPAKSHRFRTVTNAWRKSVEPELYIVAERGLFIVLDEPGKLRLSHRKMKSAGRCVRRSVVVGLSVDTAQLTDAEKKQHLQLQQRQASVKLSMQQRIASVAKPSLLD